MAQFNNKDQRNLEELLEEGWMDRLKARGAEALGSAKGLGQQIKGGFQQAAGSALSKTGGAGAKAFGGTEDNTLSNKGQQFSKQGQESEREGSVSGHNAKVEYLQKNIDKRIRAFTNDIKNDIQKLGLDIGNIEFVSEINSALNHLKKSVSGVTPPPSQQQSEATPPPLPKQQAPEPEPDEDEPENTAEYSYKKATSKKSKPKPQPTSNPRKGKVKKDPLAKYAAPEQEEDLDKMFWER
jgi:hypothetical protein